MDITSSFMHSVCSFLKFIIKKSAENKTLDENRHKIYKSIKTARVCDLVARKYYRSRMHVYILGFVLYVLYRDSFIALPSQ